jgi:hypothetical protein
MSGLKDGSNMKAATGCAQASRTAKAGSFHGGPLPKGPKAEPVRTNGIKAPKEKGVSK